MSEILRLLKKHWNHDSFRELQEDIILSVLDGHDTVGLLPTGGGKSVTFQIPALVLGGLTLVVTPLVSLMKDQVDNLKRMGLNAAYMHSAMTYVEMKHTWDRVLNSDKCRFLYVSPERLAGDHFCEQLRLSHKVRMVVVDEAHCISQWGHDFRPAYLNIARLRRYLPAETRFMALTASATPQVVEDICISLQVKSARVFRKSFARDNVSYVVRHTDDKDAMMLRVLSGVPGTSIVYVRSRRRTREIADKLCQAGVKAAAFHAGLPFEQKQERQQAWKEGTIRVMVATNAFGMGIDKPDVRSVIHYSMPSSLEEYYQEAGRAGRDGLPSYAVALVGPADKSLLRRRVSETFPDKGRIAKVYELMCNFLHISLEEGAGRVYTFDIKEFCRVFDLQEKQVAACMALLTGAGYAEFIDDTDSQPRVMFVCEREELYHLDNRDFPDADKVIDRLLRLYPGLFTDYVAISVVRLAQECGINTDRVHETLIALSRGKVISYIPRRTVPCVYMPQPRVEPQYLMIPRAVYEDRRSALERRIESVIGYTTDDGECRQVKILRYFGQTAAKRCGCCDVCRDVKRAARKMPSDSEMAAYLLRLIGSRQVGCSVPELLDTLPAHRTQVADVLAQLEDEGVILLHNNNYIVK